MTVPVQPTDNVPPTVTGTSTNPPNPPAQTFTADDLERARQQEKEKLYAEMTRLREQANTLSPIQQELEALRKERQDREAAELAARQQAEQEAKAKRESEMSAKDLLSQKEQEWEQRFAELQRQREAEAAVLAKERETSLLQDYIRQRVVQEKDSIAPELVDLVDGSSQAEIDASIERLKQKSVAIAENIRATQQQMAAQMPGVSAAGYGGAGPMDMFQGQTTYTAQDIANMSPREYAEKVRPHYFGNQNNRGLYG